DLNHPVHKPYDYSKSMYLDASDRLLSSGEIFVLFVLGLTFVGCLVLAIAVAVLRGEPSLQTQLSSYLNTQQIYQIYQINTQTASII
ncbi:MAG: J domain-containing protein, partial [Sphaerospermopsis kisseleviana]